jgi:acyl carrier protein
MDKKQFMSELSNCLEIQNEFNGTEYLSKLDWDSMKALSFVALVDELYGISVTGDEISKCKTVNDLIAIVSKDWVVE